MLSIRNLALAAALTLGAGAGGAEEVTLQGDAGADTAPYQFSPSLTRGAYATLWAFSDPANEHSFETFLHFELPPEWLCGQVEVEEATLFVNYSLDSTSQGSGSNVPGTLECRRVLEPWDEATMTWSTRPDYDAPVDVVTGITALGDIACDVTDLVADWVACDVPNHGFAVTNPTDRLIGFYSFEAPVSELVQPALVVTVPEPGVEGTYAAVALLAVLAQRRGRRRCAARARRGGA